MDECSLPPSGDAEAPVDFFAIPSPRTGSLASSSSAAPRDSSDDLFSELWAALDKNADGSVSRIALLTALRKSPKAKMLMNLDAGASARFGTVSHSAPNEIPGVHGMTD